MYRVGVLCNLYKKKDVNKNEVHRYIFNHDIFLCSSSYLHYAFQLQKLTIDTCETYNIYFPVSAVKVFNTW